MRTINKILQLKFLIVLLFFGLFFFFYKGALAQYDTEYPSPTPRNTAAPGQSTWSNELNPDQPAKLKDFEAVFGNVVRISAVLAGVACLVMLIAGGFSYLMAGGDPKRAEAARNTITYAFLGLVLLISAYIILNFVAELTGLMGILTFTIPSP